MPIEREIDYKNRAVWFVFISVLAHATLMMMLSRDWTGFSKRDADKSVDVEFVPMSAEQIAKIRAQIAETTLVEKSKDAAKDAYLGQQTQVVRDQSRAKETAPFHDGKTGGAQGANQAQAKNLALGNLGVHMDYKPLGNLGPGATASTSDYLKEVKQGAQTLLNTKEFAYFSFYQRVRKQLEQYWEPGLRVRLKGMFDRGRQLAADKEHLTRVMVVMDKEGTITHVKVEGTSGFLDLDQAAVDAFNKAGPFPNPPKGMIENDGTVKVEWEFVLKT